MKKVGKPESLKKICRWHGNMWYSYWR